MYERTDMPIGAPLSISYCRRFFAHPASAKQRQHDALRAFFVDERPSAEVARAFGYTPGLFPGHVPPLSSRENPVFFVTPRS